MSTYESIRTTSELHRPSAKRMQLFREAGAILAGIAIVLMVLVLAGWALNVGILMPPVPHIVPAHVLGVANSILLGISALLFYRGRAPRLRLLLSALVAVVSTLVLLEYFINTELPFEAMLRDINPAAPASRIAPNSALCQCLLSISLLLLSRNVGRFARIAQFLCICAGSVAALAVIGHAYAEESFYGIGDYSAMSTPGSINYLFLSTAVLFLFPHEGIMRILTTGSSAGVMSRRLYAAVLAVPPLLGFIVLVGATDGKLYDLSFGISMLVVSCMLLFAAVIAMTSNKLERTDLFRLKAEEELRASRERLRELSSYMQVMQEEERLRIAREVHDELGQSLTALKMDIALMRNKLSTDEPELERRTGSMMSLINSTIRSVQRISTELRPSLLDDLGLAAAIEWQAKEFETRSGVHCTVNVPVTSSPIPQPIATALFRIFQETLTNVARHARAANVFIWLDETSSDVRLEVRDDGVGIREEDLVNSRSLGVMGMRERAKLLGGSVELAGNPAGGTTMTARIPLNFSHSEPLTLTESAEA